MFHFSEVLAAYTLSLYLWTLGTDSWILSL